MIFRSAILGLAGFLIGSGGILLPEAKATTSIRLLTPDDQVEKLPKLDKLRTAIAVADRLEVDDISFGTQRRFPHFTCGDAKAVHSLIGSFVLVPNPTTITNSCVCGGEFCFRFYSGEKLIAEIGLRNAHYLRPKNSEWLGDGELTKESRTAINSWFSSQDFPLDVREYAEVRSRKIFTEAFTPEFLAAAKALRSGDTDPENFRETSFAGIPGGENPVELGKRICRSLYSVSELDGYGSVELTNCSWLLGRFSDAQWDSLLRACEGNDAALCGAWSVFSAQFDRLDEKKRSGWLLKIAEAKFRVSKSGDAASLFYRLWCEASPESFALLRKVAAGEIKTGMIELSPYGDEPVRADVFACLPLSWSKDDADTLAVIGALEKRHAAGSDALNKTERLLLDIARENSSYDKQIMAEHLKLQTCVVGYAWRVLANRDAPDAVDLLIPLFTEPSSAHRLADSDRYELATTLATMTGRKAPPGRLDDETDSAFRERIDTWVANFAKWWAEGRAPLPAQPAK